MRFLTLFLLTLCLLLAGSAVFAQTSASQPTTPTVLQAPTIPAPPADTIQGTWAKVKKASRDHHYRELIGLIVLLAVAFWRRYGYGFILWRLSSWWQGFVVCAIAFLAVIGTNLASNNFDVGSFIVDTIGASGEAMVFWQMILKKIKYFKGGDQAQAKPADPAPTPPSDLAEAHP